MPKIRALVGSKWSLAAIYIANIILALHYYLVIYINSSLLDKFVPKEKIGLLYSAGALINLFILFNAGKLVRRWGGYRLVTTFIVGELIAILGLAFSTHIYSVIPFFILHQAVVSLSPFCLDLFLEKSIREESYTGRMRSLYLTLANATLLIGPAIIALLLGTGDEFSKVYLLSALFLIPVLVISRNFKNYGDLNAPEHGVLKSAREMFAKKDIWHITAAQFTLQFFFVFMVIYMPVYLHETIGFSWATIGSMLTVILLPFVLFEIPAGRLADTKLGEKEILSVGFTIIALATASITFTTSTNPIVWTALLFLTRTGASLIEAMTETYFFKHVNAGNTDTISFFRMTSPIAYLVAPTLASVLLIFAPFQYLFLFLSIIMLYGLWHALSIKDTL